MKISAVLDGMIDSIKLGALVVASTIGLVGCAQPGNAPIASSALNGAIIGGSEATGQEDFSKSIVSLYNLAQGSICTASILSDSILLTAAHCVNAPASSLRLVFGVSIESPGRIVRKIDAYEVSPLWPFRQTENTNSGDVAIVRFSGGLPEGFRPTPVLTNMSYLENGGTILLAGYGISNGVERTGGGRLRFVETTIEDAAFSESEVLINQTGGKGACHGDSGGPAYVRINGQWVLWGVTNRGVRDPNNDCSRFAAYATVPFWKDWIQQTAQALNAKFEGAAGEKAVAANQ